MISRRGIIAAGVLAALALFYYLYEVRGGRQRETRAAEEKKVFHLEESAVREIVLERTDQEIRLVRTDEGWALKDPLEAPADDSAVDSLLSSVIRTTIEEKVGPREDLEEYGLDRPAVAVELAGAEGEEGGARERLRVGSESPISSDFYALVGDDPEVVLVSSAIRPASEKKVLDLRDRKLVDLQSWKVDRFELQRGKENLEFLKENGHWHLERPFRTPADDGNLGDLLSHIGRLEAKGFAAEDPEELEPYGLADPPVRVAIRQEDWKEPRRFEFGGADPEGNRYARRLDRPAVMEVEAEIWPKLNQPLGELRRSSLLEAGRWNVARVDLEDDGGIVTLEKDEEGEWRAGGGDAAAQPVEDLLDALEDLRADGFEDRDLSDPTRFGLDRPRLRAVVWTKTDLEAGSTGGEPPPAGDIPPSPRPFELQVGGPAGPEETYVKDARWPTVYRVPTGQVTTLQVRIADLRQVLAPRPGEGPEDAGEPEGGAAPAPEESPGEDGD